MNRYTVIVRRDDGEFGDMYAVFAPDAVRAIVSMGQYLIATRADLTGVEIIDASSYSIANLEEIGGIQFLTTIHYPETGGCPSD